MHNCIFRLLVLGIFSLTAILALADPNTAPFNVGVYSYSVYSTSTLSASVVPIIQRNPSRAGLILQNNGSVSAVIKLGSTIKNCAAASPDGIVLTAGTLWLPVPTPVDAVYACSVSSTGTVTGIESVK